MFKLYSSLLSAVFFISTTLPIIMSFSQWGEKIGERIFQYIININAYLPFVFAILGIGFALIGLKGKVKVSLVLINIVGFCFYLLIFLIGNYGFQEP